MIWATKHFWWNSIECREFPKGSIWPPVLDLHCREQRNKRHKNVSWRQSVTLCFEFPAFCQAKCSMLFKCKFSIGESSPPARLAWKVLQCPLLSWLQVWGQFIQNLLSEISRLHYSWGCFLQHPSKERRNTSVSTTDWFSPIAVPPNHLLLQFTCRCNG